MAKRPNYIFTSKRHPNRAIMSTILGVLSTLSLVAVVYLSYAQGGDAPISYGLTGLLIAVFSMTGLILGVLTAREKDSYKFFPWSGIIWNTIALIGIGVVVYLGMYL